MTPPPAVPDAPDVTSAPTTVSVGGADAASGFGLYRFLQRLGEGGMGEVWLAEQLRPVRRNVAIKIVKTGMDMAQVVARFEAERQALAVIERPGGILPPLFLPFYELTPRVQRKTAREGGANVRFIVGPQCPPADGPQHGSGRTGLWTAASSA